MADYSLEIAQNAGANPIVCMISSLLHRLATNVTGEFRSNKVNALLREFGFDSKTIDLINICVINLLPEYKLNQQSNEEKVVSDAYLLTYWQELKDCENYSFNFKYSENIFHAIEN